MAKDSLIENFQSECRTNNIRYVFATMLHSDSSLGLNLNIRLFWLHHSRHSLDSVNKYREHWIKYGKAHQKLGQVLVQIQSLKNEDIYNVSQRAETTNKWSLPNLQLRIWMTWSKRRSFLAIIHKILFVSGKEDVRCITDLDLYVKKLQVHVLYFAFVKMNRMVYLSDLRWVALA